MRRLNARLLLRLLLVTALCNLATATTAAADKCDPRGARRDGDRMKHVALLLAKEGSIGCPGKNLYVWKGKTLVEHTISAPRESGCFDGVFLSTNGSRTAAVARAAGAHVILRPDALAANEKWNE